jgi:hypothetical protein
MIEWISFEKSFPDENAEILVVIEMYESDKREKKIYPMMSGRVKLNSYNEKIFKPDIIEFSAIDIFNYEIKLICWSFKPNIKK